MSLYDCANISSIGLQSESVMMKDSVMNEYKNRFKKVICLFDNDEAGKKLSKSFTEKYDIPHFFVPELPKVTDFSDLVKSVGIKEAVTIINTKISKL
jgi:5S rRNA maturation endonuclease (ribonuclease M5)